MNELSYAFSVFNFDSTFDRWFISLHSFMKPETLYVINHLDICVFIYTSGRPEVDI